MNQPEFDVNEIIELAWADDVSFDVIETQTGLTEAKVIQVMRNSLKPSSFRLWRKRVSGRTSKHMRKMRPNEKAFNRFSQ